MTTNHTPVLLNEVVDIFEPINSGIYVDATIGAGGHALAIAKAQFELPISNFDSNSNVSNNQTLNIQSKFKIQNSKFIGIDQDYSALELASENLKEYGDAVTLVHGNFRNIKGILQELKIEKVNGILADLGVSSMQIDSEDRGFSFKYDAPLDMRMRMSTNFELPISNFDSNSNVSNNQTLNIQSKLKIKNSKFDSNKSELSAEMIIKTWNEAKIADILWQYGEERFSRKIAKAIAQNRKNINSTKDLAEICEKCVPPRFRKFKIHPATKTFQALRIAVNDEIESLKDFLRDAPELLAPGGRLAIISFHSLEDRLVKQKFNELSAFGEFEKITKQVVVASEDEIAKNPRSRSAKLRCIEKL